MGCIGELVKDSSSYIFVYFKGYMLVNYLSRELREYIKDPMLGDFVCFNKADVFFTPKSISEVRKVVNILFDLPSNSNILDYNFDKALVESTIEIESIRVSWGDNQDRFNKNMYDTCEYSRILESISSLEDILVEEVTDEQFISYVTDKASYYSERYTYKDGLEKRTRIFELEKEND